MADSTAELERGRSAHASRAWGDGFEALSAADGALPLGAADLERLATCAFMLGREDDYLAMLERAHGARLDQGRPAAAVREPSGSAWCWPCGANRPAPGAGSDGRAVCSSARARMSWRPGTCSCRACSS